jgi:cell division protein ZapA
MGQVAVTLNGRTFTLQCADGEEARVIDLASYVKARADALAEEFLPDHGMLSDDRLLLLTAIMIADELWQARESMSALPAVKGAHADSPLPPPLPTGAAAPRANGRAAR